MPHRDDHIDQANRNRSFWESLNIPAAQHLDWSRLQLALHALDVQAGHTIPVRQNNLPLVQFGFSAAFGIAGVVSIGGGGSSGGRPRRIVAFSALP